MPILRPRFRLGHLMIAILLAGLALGLARNWRSWGVASPADRIVSEVLATRAARADSVGASMGDPAVLGGFIATIIFGSPVHGRFRT